MRGSLLDIERFIRIPIYISRPVRDEGKDEYGNWKAYEAPTVIYCFLRPQGWRKRFFHGDEIDEEGQVVTFERVEQGDRLWLPEEHPDTHPARYPQNTSPVYDEYGRRAYYVTRL
jgi:hypothetical protein